MDDAHVNTGESYRDETRLDDGQTDGGSDWKLLIEADLEAVLNHGSVSNEHREGLYFKLIDGEWFGASI